MSLATQLGSPLTAHRAVCASAVGLAAFLSVFSRKKGVFDGVMVGAFTFTLMACVPLTSGKPE
jgi:hypothetical protein